MKKKELQDLQARFWNYLSKSPEESSVSLDDLIVSDEKLPPQERMDIYANAYRWRLQGALLGNFKTLTKIIGEEPFAHIIDEYLLENPSENFSVTRVGERLPQFLAKHKITENFPWAHELALFEWTKLSLFNSPDHDTLTLEDLTLFSSEQWPRLQFKLIPSLALIPTTYRIEDIEEDQSAIQVNPQTLKVWRKGEEIHYATTTSDEDELLMAIRACKNFSEICSHFSQNRSADEATQTLFALLSEWVEDGLVEKLFIS
jgi:hypothetical protein